MIIVMRKGATKEQCIALEERIREAGLEPHVIHGTERNVYGAVGDERVITEQFFEVCEGVERVMPILAPYKLASVEVKPEKTAIQLGSSLIGGQRIGIIAGPCSVESRAGIIEAAQMVKEAGAIALRGGAYKPRTNPYAFQGLQEEGLEYLAEAREATGLPVVTEVLSPEGVEIVAKFADVLQVGARNMQNFLLLKALGNTQKPVLLKRGMSATIQELLFAAEYILSAGNPNVILCERGIRTFEDHTRNTLSLSSIPALRERTHLPVLADPSHGTGHASLVGPMSKAAIAAGADGLIIEVHPHPEKALVDGAQSLNPQQFIQLMKELKPLAQAVGREM
ncbi:MAG: 3-deoxy-7-phosphoheptulonate synthase [Planctomycetes bacterium]|nr:3-deoxy-7-phosphoheptulonate synthase [Planctomycetota bacterium]